MSSAIRPHRNSFFASFSRSQVSSFIATLVDYGTVFLLVEAFRVWYVIATGCGALIGAITNFLINRHWSFAAGDKPWSHQACKYFVVSLGSLILNTIGVFLVTEYLRVHYAVSVVAVSILVGFLFNYPLQRHFVFHSYF